MEKTIVKVIVEILKYASPMLKKEIREFIKKLEDAAEKTPNPVDNILVEVLKVLVEDL